MVINVFRRLWTAISHGGTFAWLWSLGGGTLTGFVGAVIASAFGLDLWLVVALFVGLLLVGAGTIGYFVQPIVARRTATPPDDDLPADTEPPTEVAPRLNMYGRPALTEATVLPYLTERYGIGQSLKAELDLIREGPERRARVVQLKPRLRKWVQETVIELSSYDSHYAQRIDNYMGSLLDSTAPEVAPVAEQVDTWLANIKEVMQELASDETERP